MDLGCERVLPWLGELGLSAPCCVVAPVRPGGSRLLSTLLKPCLVPVGDAIARHPSGGIPSGEGSRLWLSQ